MTYSDSHLQRKLEGYGPEPVPAVDAYRWPAYPPDEPAARHTITLDTAALPGHPGNTRDTTV